VRCFYKRQVTAEDINLIARAQPALLQMPGVNPEVCFVLLESWDELKEYLYRLADEKSGRTIVPLADMDLAEGTDSLRKTLDLWLFRRDLYDVRVPVTGKKFFGRERELVALDRSIDDGEWVGLFGLRKIGKTSTIEEIGRRRSND